MHRFLYHQRFGQWFAFCLCVCILFSGCARVPQVPPEKAFDYGQIVLRELPPDIEPDALKGKRIVIDPGHGGVFPGAVGPNNLREADVNLGVGLYLWGMLSQAGAEVSLTRVEDTNVYQGDDLDLKKDLHARAELAEARQADLFVSLHHNADVLPGAKKNSLETYFKMGDPGPSLDAAKSIHRQLALSLSQEDNVILPGNFHVLRENPATAVLGEPSYISHKENAFRLGLAPMQRLEAQAYFLGIAEYFSKGVPGIEDMEPAGTISDDPRPLLTARVIADRGVPIDPDSISVLIDGGPVEANFDRETSRIRFLPSQRLTNEKHSVRISLRNIRGNAARPWEDEIDIAMPPAYLLVSSNFQSLRVRSAKPIRLSARVLDVDMMPVADDMPVEFDMSGGTVRSGASVTRDGEAVAYFVPEKGAPEREITVTASTSGLSQSLKLTVTENAPEIFVATVSDAIANLPVANALAAAGGRPLGYSDGAGYFAVALDEIGEAPIRFSRRGYEPQQLDVSDSHEHLFVKMRPIANAVLFGQKFALDPQFGGEEKGATGPTGVRASDLNLLVADYLARFLQASGARVILTRESDESISALRRVELAEKSGAQWFISIGHGGNDSGPSPEDATAREGTVDNQVSVMHYPKSEEGKQLAAAIANACRSQGIADSVSIVPNSRFVLTHTSSPAVVVEAPGPSAPKAEEQLWHPRAARREAYAIYCGILENLGLNEANTGQITVSVTCCGGDAPADAMVTLDGALNLETDSPGECRFSRLVPGEHRIEVYSEGRQLWAGPVSVEAGRTTLVNVSPYEVAIAVSGIM